MRVKFLLFFLFLLVPSFAIFHQNLPAWGADWEEEDYDPMFGIKEGWAWPVVVIQPPEGWESGVGESIKYALRAAEREVSTQREAIRGREVTFMFSSVTDSAELVDRIRTWRGMRVAAILSFGDDAINQTLHYLCRDEGPSVVFAAGENLAIKNPTTGKPFPYLFALDFPYNARANALAEVALNETPVKKVAVLTDIMSTKLATGAELNVARLRARGIETLDLSVAGFRQDQFIPQIRDIESGGIRVFTCWLDAMATLSIWRTAYFNRKGSIVYYAGNRHMILLDAEGLVVVDKDVLMERNESGKRDIITMLRDMFNRQPEDPVIAAKAYALGKWAIGAYKDSPDVNKTAIAAALAKVDRIPLMDDTISVNPDTHRPKSRKFGVLRVEDRAYKSHGMVEVFSDEVTE